MPVGSAREILRRLHDVMAARSPAQAKLDEVVRVIAEGLGSDVASIYLRRDGVLELRATRGLKQEAVHVTRLAVGEGLVGTIAETKAPLSLAEAREHPRFAYRPETGEERFHSFAGVPIVHREAAIGVLCVQHVRPRTYDDVEIEVLQTVAMVLAELIAAAGLVDQSAAPPRPVETGPVRLDGLRLVDGIARGVAVFHQPRLPIERRVADDVAIEHARIERALATLRAQIDQMVSRAEFAGPGDHDEILETYRMFALDEGWVRRIHTAIEGGLTAEAAIDSVAQAQRIRLEASRDPYLRERIHDLEDLSNRLIRILAGRADTAAALGLSQESILIARNLGPAELLEYDRRYLKGVALEEGSLTAHVTIIARAMGVPMLGRIRNLRERVSEGDPLILDATAGALHVRPSPALLKAFAAQKAALARREAEFRALRGLPAETRDGVRIALYVNAGLRSDLDALEATGAEGIGLFRTEFQFLVSATLPRLGRQVELYRSVLEAAGERPVVFRTVDIGGDKAVPYLGDRDGGEENPAMGWRALRLSLERRGLLAAQARALLLAAAGRELRLMFPMITEPWEFLEARAVVEEARRRLEARGRPLPQKILYGAMLEVPALADLLDELLPRIDFLSIGTNDLTQFLMAADRGNPKVAARYDWLSRGVLRYLARVVAAADQAGVPVTVCGEMGGRTLEALALAAIGVRRLSITPAAVGPVKAMLRSVTLAPIAERVAQWLDTPGCQLREALRAEAERQGARL
ncbi:MAG: phosphoenolpyruvate--protein phosphotransferase [Sphingomonadaceae bacterium]|uniref:phosphoenolpyruvate--protein phosphotransferase n=1 Tax=Thermaurantiacus sp. TaxID=2820283 RepID=UPI00298ED962|nr:phosphoenolpyruvate--protein phosphotransferase [Thermaurantiacus sp.]MCS6987607.1 phosphoenolpyruvate--protein phosphotransferase [Sphingomonadaceae bacterium]MDW8415208.1 phosphoenolpyruvate--protein phosphotransferase [Thermaurantiacus sp.]